MDMATQFILLVQTGAIVRDIACGRMAALSVVAGAMLIPASYLPADLVSAARQYLDYQYQTSPPDPKISAPDWLQSFWGASKEK